MKKELPKTYDPKTYEDSMYQKWEESGFFNPDACIKAGITSEEAEKFSIVLPPPNVTGYLHTGHAAMLAIEDVFVRFHRMLGHRTLWIPGTDHAAIATQTKVEKIIKQREGKSKHDLGREQFLQEVRNFAKDSHDTIIHQTKKMGASLDWSREAYTLDAQRSLAVRTAFKKMYDDGLIYQGERVVNWCPHCNSTLADDEVEYRKQPAKLYTFKYAADFPISISTTRPETKLGDSAIAVNPKDERYVQFIGKTFSTNFCGVALAIKIIADRSVEMEFGTGALGVTPAHSMIDWKMAQKNDLPIIKVIDEHANIREGFGEFSGKSALEAREEIISHLKKQQLITKEEDMENNLSVCYRCGTAVEPLPSLQWFIDVTKKFAVANNRIVPAGTTEASLKGLMLWAVDQQHTRIIPENFTKTYFHWIENLEDWCISRQIWFGHQIPVWYRGNEVHVGIEAPTEPGWIQDQDTLDTWFSSGLWTFSTLGWPEENTLDYRNYHPTTLLETGYDILFFWVARMILMATYLVGDVPFQNVYLHGLVRDEKGRKMSKSLGNVIDPLDVITTYGTDSLRLSLMLGSTPGQDMKLGEEKMEGFRNFTNKLWNISRYILSASEGTVATPAKEKLTLADSWILQKLAVLIDDVTSHLEDYQISPAGEKLKEFTWNEFADWYIEISKFETNREEKEWILAYVLKTLLKLWHPFMPFVTEAIWSEMGSVSLLMIEKWPSPQEATLLASNMDSERFGIIREIITSLRNARIENGIDPGKKVSAIIDIANFAGDKDAIAKTLEMHQGIIKGLRTGIEKVELRSSGQNIENAIARTVSGINIFIPLEGIIDRQKEAARIRKDISAIESFVTSQKQRLSNPDFLSKAPEKVISQQRETLAKKEAELVELQKRLASFI